MPYDAPDPTTTATFKLVSFCYIDASGDVRTDTIQVPVAATAAQVKAVGDALGAITNASIYRLEVNSVWNSIPDKSNATDAVKDSVFDNLVALLKNTTNDSKRGFIPAPVGSLFVSGTDQIDPTSVPLGDYFTALLALVGAGWEVTQARYTERREINEAVKI